MSHDPAGVLPGQRLKERWRSGRATLNGWLAAPDPTVAENMAVLGWDSLTIDLQHGMADYAQALRMLIAMSTADVVPMARVPWLEESMIMRLLDAGAHGIICPMINSQQEAVRLAKACRYAPRGARSFGPIRARLHMPVEYWTHANDAVIVAAMIETREGVDALDGILDVDELDAIYIGPADLALSLGFEPGFDPQIPEVVTTIEQIIAAAKSKGKFVGIHNGTAQYARRMVEAGADFVTVSSDLRLMVSAAQSVIAEFRDGQTDDA